MSKKSKKTTVEDAEDAETKVALTMMSLPRYRHQTLANLQHLILDPLIRDRIAIAYPGGSDANPSDDIAGVAIWASVTP